MIYDVDCDENAFKPREGNAMIHFNDVELVMGHPRRIEIEAINVSKVTVEVLAEDYGCIENGEPYIYLEHLFDVFEILDGSGHSMSVDRNVLYKYHLKQDRALHGWKRDDKYPLDWDQRRKVVYSSAGYECEADGCYNRGGRRGRFELHADHVVPISEGGTHEYDNLRCLCSKCHDKRHREEHGFSIN